MAKGRKTGGRKKGSLNKSTAARKAAVAALNHSGTDPVSFFSDVLRDEHAPRSERRYAARILLPYYHPSLDGLRALLIEFAGEGGGYHEIAGGGRGRRGPHFTRTKFQFQPIFAPTQIFSISDDLAGVFRGRTRADCAQFSCRPSEVN